MSTLEELQLNRNLYRTQPQTVETLSADQVASNLTPTPSNAIASGNSVTDVNTNAEQINGSSIAPGTIPPATLDVSNWGWTQTSAFSVVDADTVQWGAGTFTSANGLSYSIGAGNTGNMSALTYIYLDLNTSTTTYQVTTNVDTPVGVGKVLIAVCQNGSTLATFNLVQAHQIVGDNIIANTINASKITAGSITATQLSTTLLYAGSIILDTNGQIRGGQTSYNNGTGFFLGYSGGLYKLSIGDSTGSRMTWDGSTLDIIGTLSSSNSNQKVIISGTSAFYYNSSGTLIMATTASSNSFLIDGQTSSSSIYMQPGSAGTVAMLDSGGNLRLVFSPSNDTFAPFVNGDLDLGAAGFNWYDFFLLNQFNYNGIVQPIIYHGYVSGTSISKDNTSFSASNPSTGTYTITHNLGTTDYTVQATAFRGSGAGAYTAKVSAISSNSFTVIVFNDTGTSVDSDWMFSLFLNR